MEFDKVIRDRFSCRKFSDRVVDNELVLKILEACRIAPSAKNMQPVRIYVIRDNLDKIDNVTPCRYGAPVGFLVCSDKDVAWKNEEEGYSSYEMDACIGATHMILEATNLGLNSVWVRKFNRDNVIKEFNLSSNIVPICFIFVGYISDNGMINPLHEVRNDIDDMVVYM